MNNKARCLLTAMCALAPVTALPTWAQQGASTHVSTAGQPRSEIALADGWRFHLGALAADPVTTPQNDAAWQAVSVPHTWNRVGYYRSDPASHVNTEQTINKTQGIGWYSLRFTPPPAPGVDRRGKRTPVAG